jgi:hypothetical protein
MTRGKDSLKFILSLKVMTSAKIKQLSGLLSLKKMLTKIQNLMIGRQQLRSSVKRLPQRFQRKKVDLTLNGKRKQSPF